MKTMPCHMTKIVYCALLAWLEFLVGFLTGIEAASYKVNLILIMGNSGSRPEKK